MGYNHSTRITTMGEHYKKIMNQKPRLKIHLCIIKLNNKMFQHVGTIPKGYSWIKIISDATNTAGIIVQKNALRGSELYPPTIEPLPSIYHQLGE